METNRHKPSLGERITAINTKLAGSNGGMVLFVIVLVIIGLAALMPKEQSSSISIISRKTSEELKSRHLIDTEYEDSFIDACMSKANDNLADDKKARAKVCGCYYENIANTALASNRQFSDVVANMSVNDKQELGGCEAKSYP